MYTSHATENWRYLSRFRPWKAGRWTNFDLGHEIGMVKENGDIRSTEDGWSRRICVFSPRFTPLSSPSVGTMIFDLRSLKAPVRTDAVNTGIYRDGLSGIPLSARKQDTFIEQAVQ